VINIKKIKVGDLVEARMFTYPNMAWVVKGSRDLPHSKEYFKTTANRKNYNNWAFKISEIDIANNMLKLAVPRIKWRTKTILGLAGKALDQHIWIPLIDVGFFTGVLCDDCGFSCSQSCKGKYKRLRIIG